MWTCSPAQRHVPEFAFQAGSPSLEARSQAMAGTDFVTDNETVTMLRMPDQRYWMRSKDSTTWVPYQP
jgi:hypothetical protein